MTVPTASAPSSTTGTDRAAPTARIPECGGLMIAEKNGLAPAREIPGGVIQWVSVAGADKAWHWAEAAIEGDTLVVSSPEVPAPVAVRYAFTARPTGPLLYNKDGFPVAPFRTDDW